MEPKTRMVFDLIDNLIQNYTSNGNEIGFEAIIRTSKKKDDGEMKHVTSACSCIGKLRSNYKSAFKMNSMTKTDCKARIGVCLHFGGK